MKAKALYSLSFLDTGHVCVFIYIIILETVKLGEGLVVYIKGQGKKWEKEVEEGFVWNPKREREREGDGGGREQGKESIVMKKKQFLQFPRQQENAGTGKPKESGFCSYWEKKI